MTKIQAYTMVTNQGKWRLTQVWLALNDGGDSCTSRLATAAPNRHRLQV